jgi:molybdate transport system substrate-binding protein
MRWIRAAVALAGAALGLAAAPTAPPELTVSAAVSLAEALEAIAPVYGRTSGARVRFNFAASNVLARQIVSGAPADVFISADEAQMDLVAAAGAIAPGTRAGLLSNRLAIVTPAGRGGTVRGVGGLLSPHIRRIAIGDPAAVPAGVYAKRYLEAAGLWVSLQPKLMPTASVRGALAAARNGAADAAIVYESDTAAAPGTETSLVVPAADGPRIVYPAAIVSKTAQRAAAERFLAFLRGPDAARIFRQFRFTPLAATD